MSDRIEPVTVTISASMGEADTYEIGTVQFDRKHALTDTDISARLAAGLRTIADELEAGP